MYSLSHHFQILSALHRSRLRWLVFLLCLGFALPMFAQEDDEVQEISADEVIDNLEPSLDSVGAQEMEVEILPRPGVVRKAHYRTEVEGEGEEQHLLVKGTLEVEAFQKGWSIIPLGEAGLSITEVSFEEAELNYGEMGFELLLPDAGSYELGFVARVPISTEKGKQSVNLDLIPGAISQVEAVFPGKGWHFSWETPVAYERANEGPDTRLDFYFSGTEPLELSWQQEEELEPIVHAESVLETKLEAESVVTQVDMRLKVQRAPIEKVEILVPFPHQVTFVQGGWNWTAEPAGAARKLTIDLGKPQLGDVQLKFTLEAAIDQLPANLELGALEVAGADRHSGYVQVRKNDRLDLKVENATGLSAKDTDVAGLLNYRFLSTPYTLELNLDVAKSRILAESQSILEVSDKRSRLRTDFEFQVSRVPVSTMKLRMPVGFGNAKVTGESVRSFEEEGGLLTVFLAEPEKGSFGFEVTASAVRDDPQGQVLVPAFQVQNVQSHEAGIKVHTMTNLRASLASPGDMEDEGFTARDGKLVPNFSYRNLAKPAVLNIQRAQPKIAAEVLAETTLRDNAIGYNWLIDFKVTEAYAETLYLEVPEPLSSKLLLDVPDESFRIVKDAEGPQEAAEGYLWWALELARPTVGSVSLSVSCNLPDPDFQINNSQTFEVPEIRPWVDQVSGLILIFKEDELMVDAEVGEGLSPAKKDGVPTSYGALNLHLALEFFKPSVPLSLSVSQSELADVPEMIVEYADATMVVSSEGGLKTEVVYWIENHAQESLEILLPEKATLIANAFVNGRELAPRIVDGTYMIPLLGSEGEAYPVRIAYEIPGEGLPEWRTILPMAELPGVEILQSRLRLFLPDDYRYNRIESAMVRTSTEDSWKDVRHSLVSMVPPIETRMALEENYEWQSPPEATDGVESPLVEEGVLVEMRRLDAPSEVLIGYGRKSRANFLDALLGLLAFFIGVWLTKSSVWTKFIYFVFVGLMALFLASSSSPHFAQVFGSVFIGVLAGSLVWVATGTVALFREFSMEPEEAPPVRKIQELPVPGESARSKRTRDRNRVVKSFKRRSSRVFGTRSALVSA